MCGGNWGLLRKYTQRDWQSTSQVARSEHMTAADVIITTALIKFRELLLCCSLYLLETCFSQNKKKKDSFMYSEFGGRVHSCWFSCANYWSFPSTAISCFFARTVVCIMKDSTISFFFFLESLWYTVAVTAANLFHFLSSLNAFLGLVNLFLLNCS